MNETKETTKTSGKLYNGVTYERETTIYTREDGRKRKHTRTDYKKGIYVARVLEWGGYCSIGRENAEMFLIEPEMSKTRTYKHKDNARTKAVELVISLNK